MGRFVQDSESHGSLRDLQILINEKSDLLDKEVSNILHKNICITWKSPIKTDQFAEYRDEDFLKLLNLESKIKVPLENFWPKLGPQWDALGLNDKTSEQTNIIYKSIKINGKGFYTKMDLGIIKCHFELATNIKVN